MFNKMKYKLFGQDIWRIGIVNNKAGEILKDGFIEDSYVHYLQVDSYDYEADPFIFKLNNNYHIAYEVFDYNHTNGKLLCVDLDGNKIDIFSDINKVKGHKSFPFIIDNDGELYCIPETSDLNKISIYKYSESGNKFQDEEVILNGDRFIDSFLYTDSTGFYLFTSTLDNEFSQKLFFSKKIIGPYVEHQCSPIISDSKYGRNGGGIILIDGLLFRVAQNCEKTYGGSLCFMRILTITPEKYEEEFYNEIFPPKKNSSGIHTFSSIDEYVVFDYKVVTYKFVNLFRKIFFKISKKFSFEIPYK